MPGNLMLNWEMTAVSVIFCFIHLEIIISHFNYWLCNKCDLLLFSIINDIEIIGNYLRNYCIPPLSLSPYHSSHSKESMKCCMNLPNPVIPYWVLRPGPHLITMDLGLLLARQLLQLIFLISDVILCLHGLFKECRFSFLYDVIKFPHKCVPK